MWRRYWFTDGGRLSAAILRIAIAVAVWWSLEVLRSGWLANAPGAPGEQGPYHPIGVWMLLGDRPPPAVVIDALWTIARVSTLAMLLGAFSRAATAVSFAATVALASLSYAGALSWSHEFNPVLLSQLAFLGARGGDALSIDALARRHRGEPARDVPRGYQWSIRLVQLTVALVFAGALFHKLRGAGFTLRWATTDNLRHQLLLRYDVGDLPRPRLVDWLLADAWRYHGAAMLSMISQAMPLAACVLVRRPVARAVCGGFFVMEVLGIAAIMQLWDLEWLLLAVVFVDWDALFHTQAAPPPVSWRVPRVASAYIVILVALELTTALGSHLDQRLRAYPFSSFQMFAKLRVRQPYDRHLPYALPAGHFVLDPPSDEASKWLDQAYRTTVRCDPRELHARLEGILNDARRRYAGTSFRGIRLELVMLETDAYPATARLEPHPVGIVAEVRDGAFTSELGSAHRARLRYFRDDRSDAYSEPVAGSRIAVAVIDDRPWVI
ncbi:MAG: hypothetical protein ABI678_20045 [Kofleriaceae bacterium]